MGRREQMNVLFICTGNICRSPLAEQLLVNRLGEAGSEGPGTVRVSVESRGTRAVVGAPMDPPTARLSLAYGGDPQHHVGRQLTSADLERADLIVALSLSHRASAAKLLPSASKRMVTLTEVAKLIELDGAGTARPAASVERAVARLLGNRSQMQPLSERDASIADPFRKSRIVHAMVARKISSAVDPLAEWLTSLVISSPDDAPTHRPTPLPTTTTVPPATTVLPAATVTPMTTAPPPTTTVPPTTTTEPPTTTVPPTTTAPPPPTTVPPAMMVSAPTMAEPAAVTEPIAIVVPPPAKAEPVDPPRRLRARGAHAGAPEVVVAPTPPPAPPLTRRELRRREEEQP